MVYWFYSCDLPVTITIGYWVERVAQCVVETEAAAVLATRWNASPVSRRVTVSLPPRAVFERGPSFASAKEVRRAAKVVVPAARPLNGTSTQTYAE
jgi:hypothetical protein